MNHATPSKPSPTKKQKDDDKDDDDKPTPKKPADPRDAALLNAQEVLKWLDVQGGLGLEKHATIKAALDQIDAALAPAPKTAKDNDKD